MNDTVKRSKVRDIAIAGAGTSGCMTAAMLARTLPGKLCRITVIEPPDPRGIGVAMPLYHRASAVCGDFRRMKQR